MKTNIIYKLSNIITYVGNLFKVKYSNNGKYGDNFALSGIHKYKQGKYLEAIRDVKKSIELGVLEYQDYEMYTILGNIYEELQLYEKSIESHLKSIELNNQFHKAWVNLGISYRKNGDFIKAEEAYKKALEINYNYAQAHSSLGAHYVFRNEPEKAIDEFLIAIDLDPALAIAYGNCALAYAIVGDFEQAYNYLELSKIRGYQKHGAVLHRIQLLQNEPNRLESYDNFYIV